MVWVSISVNNYFICLILAGSIRYKCNQTLYQYSYSEKNVWVHLIDRLTSFNILFSMFLLFMYCLFIRGNKSIVLNKCYYNILMQLLYF